MSHDETPTTHDHQWDLVLLCGTCGQIMAPPDSQLMPARLIRYVAPHMTQGSDNLTNAESADVVFTLTEDGHA